MKVSLYKYQNKIFILGAGASKDYGLPVWNELDGLIRNYLLGENGKENKYKKEILEWLDLIGDDKKYKTIDECIYHQSSSEKYKENGQEIEFEIFRILEELFKSRYRKGTSWIQNLNEKIRKKEGLDWNNIFFINYNYDGVLGDNILDFSYLSKTERERIHRERLEEISLIENKGSFEKIPCVYPHGLFEFSDRDYLREMVDTINSHDESLPQAVSCYHGKEHQIIFSKDSQRVDLYILGLGGGLKTNLEKIVFSDIANIKNIHITIKPNPNKSEQENEKIKKEIISFLQKKFNLLESNIISYEDCASLIEECFFIF